MSLKLAILLAGVFAGFTSACSLRHVTTYGLLIQSLNDSLPQDYNFPVTVLPVRCQNFSDIAMLKSSLTHLHSMAGKELKPKVSGLLEQIQFENCSALEKFDGSGFEVQFWNTSYFVAQLFTTLNNFNDCHMNGRTCPAAWPEKRSCLPTDSSTTTVPPTDSSSTTVTPTDSSTATVSPTDNSTATVTPAGVIYEFIKERKYYIIFIIFIISVFILAAVFYKRRTPHRPLVKSDNGETAETESLRAVASV
ncbi:uncharacterized protein LOC117407576 isoform X5 [Acipenser ruthenus]|uniref:uncharacterized protein LOC117407576 isoform X5 n=1 Tax=Acipenser ruthenus TaxID=7906 RepID=UPI0027410F23|nr:uncharacterized protein LOC117407576 isoform X5 [Acipenser ruthenus]XP_058876826.1 uncharacterized protein LOC117407576 isoform X5 [Acipenser ruthenus]XP_058876827.1 uncharacterized protein LOC117407576 isoform X5 [Acipenser ruthenus]